MKGNPRATPKTLSRCSKIDWLPTPPWKKTAVVHPSIPRGNEINRLLSWSHNFVSQLNMMSLEIV